MALAHTIPDQDAGAGARIGPNAVLQLEQALLEAGGPDLAWRIFEAAGYAHLLEHRPDAMIDEAIPRALFDVLFNTLSPRKARAIADRAGRLTGRYILMNRIPGFARLILKLLPPRMAAPMLLKAIERHAWTFAGSGQCRTQAGPKPQISIQHNPLAMPECVWHGQVLQTLFQALVSPHAQIRHSCCEHAGDPICRFDIDLKAA
jgi:divinyl protochlorophyllide a 8-vinyl-reductase